MTTPWGSATLVERVTLAQRVGEKRFSSFVELLEDRRGGRLVRFAYGTGGTARRGPVTLRERDLERLRAELRRAPSLAELLGLELFGLQVEPGVRGAQDPRGARGLRAAWGGDA